MGVGTGDVWYSSTLKHQTSNPQDKDQYLRVSTKLSMILTGSGMWNFSYERALGTLETRRKSQQVSVVVKHQMRRGLLPSGDPLDWCLESQEAPLLDFSSNLRANASRLACLVNDDQSSCPVDALLDGLYIPRKDGPEIDKFNLCFSQRLRDMFRQTLRRVMQKVDCGLTMINRRAPCEDGDVGSWYHCLSLSEWN